LLGEKNIIGERTIGQPLGWLEINGAFTLDNKDQIIGSTRNKFRKSRS
jgi:hypothetical protein